MSILKQLLEALKDMLPILKGAAEQAFEKLSKEKQQEIIAISKLIEVIKQARGKDINQVAVLVEQHAGITTEDARVLLLTYLKQKGQEANTFNEAVSLIWADASQRTVTGLKSLWLGFTNLVSEVAANIDWQVLVMGIGEYVYRNYVKGKIKI